MSVSAPFAFQPKPSASEKRDENWYIQNAWWLLGLFYSQENARERAAMSRCAAIASGEVNEGEINYLTYPEGQDEPGLAVMARYEHYPLIEPIFRRILGDFLKTKLQISGHVVDRQGVLDKEEKKVAMATEQLLTPIVKEIEQLTGIKVAESEYGDLMPKDLQALQQLNFRENYEDAALDAMDYLEKMHGLQQVYRIGLDNFLKYQKVVFRNRRVGNDWAPEACEPQNMVVVLPHSGDEVDKADAAAYVAWRPVYEVIEENKHELSVDQLGMLEDVSRMQANSFASKYYSSNTFPAGTGYSDFYRGIGSSSAQVLTCHFSFKVLSEMYVKRSPNKYAPDHPFIKSISSEKYKDLPASKKSKYNSYEFYDLHGGMLLGHNALVGWGRRSNQIRKETSGYKRTTIDFQGVWQSSKLSLANMLYPLAVNYNTVYFHIDRLLANSGIPAVELFLHEKPAGWSNSRWMFYAKHKGVILRQYKEEDGYLPSQNSQATRRVDMGLNLSELINLLYVIEQTAYKFGGTNAATQGALGGNEGLGLSRQNILNSNVVRTSIYYDHGRAIEKNMNALLDLNKMTWKPGDVKTWMGRAGAKILELSDDFFGHEVGLFLENTTDDIERQEKMLALAERAVASGGFEYLDYIIDVVDAGNASEAKAAVKRGIEALRNVNQALQQETNRLAEEANKLKAQELDLKRSDFESRDDARVESSKLQADSRVEVAKINVDSEEAKHEVGLAADAEKMLIEQNSQ